MRPAILAGLFGLLAVAFSDAVPSQAITDSSGVLGIESHSHNTSHASRSLSARTLITDPADDTFWNKCVCKGINLLEEMTMTDRDAAQSFYGPPAETVQSKWTRYSDLADWGYSILGAPPGTGQTDFSTSPSPVYHEEGWGIDDALRGWGLSDKDYRLGGKWDISMAAHYSEEGEETVDSQTYVKDGRTLRVRFIERLCSIEDLLIRSRYTGAYSSFAINPEQGGMFPIHLCRHLPSTLYFLCHHYS
jgi:hypothetical protein